MCNLVLIGEEELVGDLDVEVVWQPGWGEDDQIWNVKGGPLEPRPDSYKLVTLNGVVTPVALDFKEEPRTPGVYISGEPVSFGHRPGQGGIFMEGSDGQFREI